MVCSWNKSNKGQVTLWNQVLSPISHYTKSQRTYKLILHFSVLWQSLSPSRFNTSSSSPHIERTFSMDYITPFVNIAFAFASVLATRQLLQRYNSISDATPTTTDSLRLSEDEPPQIAENVKTCMICRSDESKDDPFIKAPCGEHFACADDIANFFEYATNDESLYPPKCCGRIFLLEEYKDHIPADIASAYHSKQQGKYSILAKYVYKLSP